MKKILQKILISEDLEIDLSNKTVNRLLSESDGKNFTIRKLSTNRYKFLANFSFGTAILQGGAGLIDGISIYGQILDGPESTTVIRLSTELRIEIILIIIVWIVMIFFQLTGSEIPIWVSLILFPIMIIWFGFIYRIQENSLMKKIKNRLKTPYNNG